MILLDPDLSPILLPQPAAKRLSAKTPPRDHRLPSTATLTRFLKLAQRTVKLRGQVSVLFTTDEAIRRLNQQFRKKNKATDVLSFPSEGLMPGLPAHLQMAGDLAISVPTALKQALEQGHSLSTEAKVLMLHGLLHLSGMDHEADQGQMARRERKLRAVLKLPQGLIERVEGAGQPTAKAARTSPDATVKAAKKPAVAVAKKKPQKHAAKKSPGKGAATRGRKG